jgi:L-threonylcarbamoyladenylate synthase
VTLPSDADVTRAADEALRSELIILPTETVYGIGTRPDDPVATARLFEAKRRPRDLELPVLVPSVDAAARIAALGDDARALAEDFWPGPLTIVVLRSPASAGWDLGGNPNTIGLRIPDHPTALAVLGRTGPLAVTSANLSGRPTPATCQEVAELFGDAVAVTLCAERELSGRASTVLDLTAAQPSILRAGAITDDELANVLPGVSIGRG